MKVSQFTRRVQGRHDKTIRDLTTYRAARRNIAKIDYRRAKKAKKGVQS